VYLDETDDRPKVRPVMWPVGLCGVVSDTRTVFRVMRAAMVGIDRQPSA
jgi:hypothetical protein